MALFMARTNTPPAPPETVSGTRVASAVAHGAATVSAFGDRPAIAVLPFDNFSPDADQALFADGLAKDLITRLASWRACPVISRNSRFKYRGGNLDLKSVSAELGAHYLVEGSVRREGDHIRVTAQLIDASTGEHVWAEKDVPDSQARLWLSGCRRIHSPLNCDDGLSPQSLVDLHPVLTRRAFMLPIPQLIARRRMPCTTQRPAALEDVFGEELPMARCSH